MTVYVNDFELLHPSGMYTLYILTVRCFTAHDVTRVDKTPANNRDRSGCVRINDMTIDMHMQYMYVW